MEVKREQSRAPSITEDVDTQLRILLHSGQEVNRKAGIHTFGGSGLSGFRGGSEFGGAVPHVSGGHAAHRQTCCCLTASRFLQSLRRRSNPPFN